MSQDVEYFDTRNKYIWLRDVPYVNKSFGSDFNSRFPEINDDPNLRAILWRLIRCSAVGKKLALPGRYAGAAFSGTRSHPNPFFRSVSNSWAKIKASVPLYRTEYIEGVQCAKYYLDPDVAADLMDWWLSYTPGNYISSTNEFLNPIILKRIVLERNNTFNESFRYNFMIQYQNSRRFPREIIQNIKKYVDDQVDLPKIERSITKEDIRESYLIHDALNRGAEQYYDEKCRIYSGGPNIQNLKSVIRLACTPRSSGYLELDLRSAHLAFFARIAESAIMNSYLEKGIWNELSNASGLSKDDVKDCVNPTLFCTISANEYYLSGGGRDSEMKRPKNEERVQKGMLNKIPRAKSKKLAEHPFIKELLHQKEKLYLYIKSHGGMENLHNEFIPGRFSLIEINGKKKEINGYGTVMHELCTTYEAELISIIYLSREELGYEIPIHQHDGCTIHIPRPSEWEGIYNILRSRISDRAQELGVVTELTIKN